ncbi:ejaculatory bulb-specific protein 3-like [Sipha flava]|uniref:Ejaculatory bulb-specific protein 3-like n=1 Tax=Sipha flava TaxID=143950 RepID=A0A8B8FR32_9HEMI|nr:ejaculatory bulb-specific protein 3-like [Sipha flava]
MVKLIVAIVCCIVLATPMIQADDIYTSKYDNINVDDILKSDRLVSNYFQCLMDNGACPQEGNLLKKLLPEAIKNDCAKCSEKQKIGIEKVIRFLTENKSDLWKQIVAKYDPEETYSQRYLEKLKKVKV